MLVDMGYGTNRSANGAWPIHSTNEPDLPDNCITVYDTQGVDEGRVMQGERQEKHGIQVRIRSATHAAGFTKARAIAVAIDQDVYLESVVVDGHTYIVHAMSRTSDVLALGKELPTSKRTVFTINATATVRQSS